jgi:hypothetical protein
VPRTRRDPRRVAVIVALALVAVLAGGSALLLSFRTGEDSASSPGGAMPTGDAVPRSPSALTRYGAIAGSASWLLYAQTSRNDKVPVTAEASPYPRNQRYLLDVHGRRTAVPVEAAVSLLGVEPLLLQLATAPRFKNIGALRNDSGASIALRWSLSSSGRSGTAALAPHSSVVTFGPDSSWVTATPVGQGDADTQFAPIERLVQHFPSGREVDLGTPFPQGAPYSLRPGPSGLVAYSDAGDGGDYPPTGQIRFRPWSGGAWRTLNPGYPPQGEIDCSPAWGKLLLCGLVGPGKAGFRSVLFRLPAGTSTVLRPQRSRDCASLQTTTETAFLGIVGPGGASSCPAGKLLQLSPTGRLAFSTRAYDQFHAPVVAFGHIVVDEYREHRLLALTTIDAEPQILVGR